MYKGCGHIKLTSPWFFEEKQGIKFSWNPCMWNGTHHKADMHILSGVVDYKYQHTTNVNAFIKHGSIVKLDAGEPLVHLIPLSDKKVKVRNHLLTDAEFSKRFAIEMQASNYNNPRNVKKPKESKCPFGFGR
jgi:hypothetical protein